MKRSKINRAIVHALAVLEANGWKLPAFAYWEMDQWKEYKDQISNLAKIMLGWDVSDFGRGEFPRIGAVLFTIRNGHPEDPAAGTPYAEKVIVLRHETEQALPLHFHRLKTEDIINRGGGVLAMQLYGCTPDAGLDRETPLQVKMDGIIRTWQPGETVELQKGSSITLPPGIYHSFWAKKGCGDLIAGEVSSINDDNTDNVFLEKQPRFSQVEEDEAALYLLCNEYDAL